MSYRRLEQPSDFFDAIRDVLLDRIQGIRVDNYDEFGSAETGLHEVDGEILIEFERATPTERWPDGRFGYDYSITLHCVVGRHRHRAALDAVNLSAAVAQVATDTIWGLPSDQVKRPEQMRAEPSLFKEGSDGYDAWGVSFSQRFALGPVLAEEDPKVGGHAGIAWLSRDPTLDPDVESSYEPIPEGFHARFD